MARLRERAARGARKEDADRAFVSGTWCSDPAAEEAAEEFVIAVTTGENAGEFMLDAVTTEENGGPFIETSAATEYAYGIEPSEPWAGIGQFSPDSVREPRATPGRAAPTSQLRPVSRLP